jgi:ankyrin repeat protein/Cdc6-like AAA superfamily ATPase
MRRMVAGAHVITRQYLGPVSLSLSFSDTPQSIVSLSTYVDKLSSLFMAIGRSTPRNEAMALLYPRSKKLQTYLSEYFIVVVCLCGHVYRFGQKSAVQQFTSRLNDSNLKAFQTELDEWANSIREEVCLNEAQENSGFRALSRRMFKSASYEQKIATNLRVLDFCSTYNHQTTWKQTRKAGNSSFFMQLAEYREWRDYSDPCTLMYTGKLGSGKSVLLANIVNDLNLYAEKDRFVVTYFFCRHDLPESLIARTILGSLARQLLCTVPDLAALSQSCEENRFADDIEEVLELLVRGFPSSHKAYFVLDGLDECDSAERETLVHAFQKIQKTLKVLVCASFRIEPNNGMQSINERLAATRVVSMPDDNPDIEAFIEADLERCLRQEKLVIGDPTLILDIQDALLRGSQGMFLWVALQIQCLCSMKTDQAIRAALADLPKDLLETFARILHKSGNSDQSLQAKTLQLVLAAYRPLTTDELREALSVTPGDTTWDPSQLLNNVHSALACCGCLLIVDEEESTVRVVHHSFKQYIINRPTGVNNVNFSAEGAQRVLADIVVTYLGYGVFGTELSRMKVHPVMAQSAPSRVMHATIGSSSTTSKVAMKLLKSRRQPAFDISKTLAEARGSSKSKPVNGFKLYSYAKSYWQEHVLYASGQDAIILKLSTKLIQHWMSEVSVVSKDYWMHCNWAAEHGNGIVLELLLKTGKIDTNAKDSYGRTPLMQAAENGYKDTMKLLLGTDKVYVNAEDNNGWTPLMLAAENGHKNIVELLLDTGKVNVDAKNKDGWTPLMLAAASRQKDIVELLLSTGKVNVDAKNMDGWTLLMQAAANGQKDIVELLLSTGKVNVDAKNKDGWTPLMRAAANGHKDTVELLFGTGKVDVDAKSNGGWTPLMQAAASGHENTVKLLLSTSKVDVNAKNNGGWTPLMQAAANGHKDIVKLLLSISKVNVNAKDNNGSTLLIVAAAIGHKDIVELLLSTSKIDVDAKNKDGWTPLMRAAANGHKDTVELLLDTGKVDVNAKDSYNQTSLMRAAENGHKDTVELLLGTGKINVNANNEDRWTLLIVAADKGHNDIVEMLLRTGKIDVNAKNKDGWTLLMVAAAKGHKDLLKLLIGTRKIDFNAKDSHDQMPLMLAAENGHKNIVELLLGTGKVNVDAKNKDGWTPLMWAAASGHKNIVELLLGTGKVDVDAKSNGGWTPLMQAAASGHKNIVELLLGTGKVDVDAKSNGGWTPLMQAAASGHKKIVELLHGTGKADVNAKDHAGSTPLMQAANNGHEDTVKLLRSYRHHS